MRISIIMNIKGKILSAIALVILFSPPSMAAQEVLNGSYVCEGYVDYFTQAGNIRLHVEMGATSGITSGLSPTSRGFSELPGDLNVLAQLCDDHLANALPLMPSSCAVGPVGPGGMSEPGGSSVGVAFSFSCKADRNSIMSTISLLSRIPLAAP
jgi:hypothetical protein